MKTALLLVVAACTTVGSFAQKIHFTDTSNTWKIIREANPSGTVLYEYINYHHQSDTTIAGLTYRKDNFDNYNSCNGCGSFVREDTVAHKVYLRDLAGDSDIVIMDYNLEVGDTFIINPNCQYTVYDTMTTYINGIPHRVWEYSKYISGGVYPHWYEVVEGIGCLQHPTFMLLPIGFAGTYSDFIYCFGNNGATPPLSPSVDNLNNTTSCTYYPSLYVSDPNTAQQLATLYPNPVLDELTITATNRINEVTIRNLVGNVVYHGQHNAPTVTIHIASLPAGVYFAHLNGIETKRFVKE